MFLLVQRGKIPPEKALFLGFGILHPLTHIILYTIPIPTGLEKQTTGREENHSESRQGLELPATGSWRQAKTIDKRWFPELGIPEGGG
jgi:hypothetical protein